jgi:hypothetical protein
MASEYHVRHFDAPVDYEMVAEWWASHGHPVVPAHHLPPIGFIAGVDGYDKVAVWIFFERNVPVCFLGHIVSAPGLTYAEVADAGEAAINIAKEFARSMGMEVMRVYAPIGIARFAKRGGFQMDERELINISYQIQQEELCLGHQQ